MNATQQRDQACALAKTNAKQALVLARQISEPWFCAQALSWVARFTDGDVLAVASEAAKAALACDDGYKKSAVCAWEIVALAERGYIAEATARLHKAVALAQKVEPASSRSEALFLLLQAAVSIDRREAEQVFAILKAVCPIDEHWRCKRNLGAGEKMLTGQLNARSFFW